MAPRSTRNRARQRWLMLCPLLASAALSSVCAQPQAAADAQLRRTLDSHLVAINARDQDALLSTVTHGERLTTILPNGKVLQTRAEYRQLHVDWFAGRDWRMVFQVQDVHAYGDVGIARVLYDSQAKDASGVYASKRVALLSLVFAREDGQWRLVYDQNTNVPGASVAPPDNKQE